MKRILIITILFFSTSIAFAQNASTIGKDFWVSFMFNSTTDVTPTLTLIATGKNNCSGTVSNPLQNWSTNFTITTGQITNINIPLARGYTQTGNSIQNTCLHITSTDSISLFASNYGPYTFDVSNVYPTHALMDEYLIQTYTTPSARRSEFIVIATEDSTTVDIKPTAACGSHAANSTFSVTLNAGQCYMVMSSSGNKELSGSIVKARDCKKINVFQGTTGSQIPVGYGYNDHIFEQCVPTAYWGKKFIVTNSMRRSKDRVKVTALNDDCTVSIDGSVVTTLASGRTYEFEILSSSPAKFIETSQPACVYLYLTGSEYGGADGDPSMTLINPVEQQIDYITFGTFTTSITKYHYVNIVVETKKVAGMRLNGNNIASQFTTVQGNPNYSYARIEIEYGSHTLQNTDGGFIAHIYGLGTDESYAYSIGSAATYLDKQIIINDQVVDIESDIMACIDEPFNMKINTNYVFNNIEWDFGDGTTASGNVHTHTYHSIGKYNITAIVERQFNNCIGTLYDTVNAIVSVNATTESYVNDTICQGESYKIIDQTITTGGQHTLDTINSYGCDSIIHLDLTINHSDSSYLLTPDPVCNEFTWKGKKYTQSGLYHFDTLTIQGCDSIMYLDLTVYHSDSSYKDDVFICDSLVWKGKSYTQSGIYRFDTLTVHGCDSIMYMNLTVYHSDSSHFFSPEPVCDNYKWKGKEYTQSGLYQFDTLTIHGCDSIMYLDLTVNHADSSYIEEITVCDNIVWKGETYKQSGIYYYDTLTIHGCDSIMYLDLTVNHADSSYIEEITVCDSITWKDKTYKQSGIYYYDTLTIHGCDSIMYLDLIVNHADSSYKEEFTVCDSIIWKGTKYTQSGLYHYDTVTVLGCDSIMYLDLIVHHSDYTGIEAITACDTYKWKDQEFDESGIHTFDTITTHGCDSTITLYLTINHSNLDGNVTETACDSYTWNGQEYTQSGDYPFETQTTHGCDSAATLHLTINYSNHTGSETETVCDNYTWNGQTYTTSGDYPFETQTTHGCDSTATLHLTINYSEYPSFTEKACDTYTWNGSTYDKTGIYTFDTVTDKGCERIETLNLTIVETPDIEIIGTHWPIGGSETNFNTHSYSIEALNTATEFDSVVWTIDCPNWYITPQNDGKSADLHIFTWISDTIMLTATAYNECGAMTYNFWLKTSYHELDEQQESNISIMPNPNNGNMEIRLGEFIGNALIKVFDNTGKQVDSFTVDGNNIHYSIPTKAVGIYHFLIIGEEKTVVKKVVIK